MKNQGFWITRVAALALSAAILTYMCYHILNALQEPLQTVTAVRITTPHTTPVNGVIVRTESVMLLPQGLVAFSVQEGEHVANGQALAVSYPSREALENTQRRKELQGRLDQLNRIKSQSTGVTDIAKTDASIRASLAGALSASRAGQPALLAGALADLQALLFRQEHSFEGEDVLGPMMDALQSEITALSSAAQSTTVALRADGPGLFSQSTDGLEAVWTESALDKLTVARFQELSAIPSVEPSGNKAKLVRDWNWYYVCLLPVSETGVEGQSRNLRFADGVTRQMTIYSVSEETNGLCVVVFSSGRYLADILSERKMGAEIVWSNYDGVRVPLSGLRIEDGRHFVFCMVLGRVVRKDVTVVPGPDSDTYYLCAYEPGLSGALLPGDEVIVSGKGLYAGKVV